MQPSPKQKEEMEFRKLFISENYQKMTDEKIASELGTSKLKIKLTRQRMGLRKKRGWWKQRNVASPVATCANQNAVYPVVKKIIKPRAKKKEMRARRGFIRKNYKTMTCSQMAEALKCNQQVVAKICNRMGLKKRRRSYQYRAARRVKTYAVKPLQKKLGMVRRFLQWIF